MIETIRYNIKLAQLRREKYNTNQLYKNEIEMASKNKGSRPVEDIISEARMEEISSEEEIRQLVTRRLLYLANKLFVPTPKFGTKDDTWEESALGYYILTPKAIYELRSAIRREQKERHDQMLMWFAAFTGFVGAVTGLIAVIGAG